MSNTSLFANFNPTFATKEGGINEKARYLPDVQTIFVKPKSSIRNSPQISILDLHSNDLETDDPESFHRAIGPILAIAQVFGILPMYGVCSNNPDKLAFKIKSFRTFYSFIISILLAIRTVVVIIQLSGIISRCGSFESTLTAILSVVFYGYSLINFAAFLYVAPKWAKLQQQWKAMERQFNSFSQDRPRLRFQFNIISFVMIVASMAEHIIWTWTDSTTMTNYDTDVSTIASIQKNFYEIIVISMIDLFAVFIWNFIDLFVILVSIGLTERYKYLNKITMNSVLPKEVSIDWLHLREMYATQSHLVLQTDDCISPLIFLSFANNLTYMCLQLLGGLSPGGDGTLSKVSYFFSFALLICRTIVVTLLAARIHDHSQKVLPVVYSCPASSFTIETQRLQHLLTNDHVALTGMKFFFITRNFMLAVASAIMTYEVILLQFNKRAKN